MKNYFILLASSSNLAVGEVAVRCVILIATDGLYDMMTNEKAVDIAFNHWSDPAAAAEEMLTQTGNIKQQENLSLCNSII